MGWAKPRASFRVSMKALWRRVEGRVRVWASELNGCHRVSTGLCAAAYMDSWIKLGFMV